ncbi:MAG: LamG-like jellyroll fold domain-containing protein [Candidatus Helarchaeota archaeon]
MSKITNYKFIADFYDWKYKRNSKRNTNNRPCANPKRLRHFVMPVIILLATISVVVFADTIIRDSGYVLENEEGNVLVNNITADRINEVLYVQVGNATDIQTKLNSANDGSILMLPCGTYVIDTSISLPVGKKVKIEGVDKNCVILQVNNTRDGFTANNNTYAHFESVTFSSNGDFATIGETNAIMAIRNYEANASVDYEIKDCIFQNLTNGLRHKQSGYNYGNVILIGNEFKDFNDDVSTGITFAMASFQFLKPNEYQVRIENNYIHGQKVNTGAGAETRGLTFNGNDNAISKNVIFKNNKVFNVTNDALRIQEVDGALFEGNEIYYFGQANSSHRDGLVLNSCKNSKVADNIVLEGYGRVLRTDQSVDSLIEGNIFYGGSNGLSGGISRLTINSNLTFRGNYIRSDKDPAFYIEADSHDNLFQDNTFFGSNVQITDLGNNNRFINNHGREDYEIHYDSNGNLNVSSKNVTDIERLEVLGDIVSDSIHDISREGLVLSMNFNSQSISGANVLDSSGNNNHGISNDTNYVNKGSYNDGGYYDFEDTVGYINLSDTLVSTLDPTNNFTISLWAKEKAATGGTNFMIGTQMGAVVNRTYIGSGYDGTLRVGVGGVSYNTQKTFQDNTWHHFVLVNYDDSGTQKFKVYMDGSQVGSTQNSGTGKSFEDIWIGKFGSETSFNGSLDDIRVYNRSLSEDELERIYFQESESIDSYVPQKDVQIDSSGNANITSGNLTIGGTVYKIGDSTGITGNYSNGYCWTYYTGGIVTASNCTT